MFSGDSFYAVFIGYIAGRGVDPGILIAELSKRLLIPGKGGNEHLLGR